MNLNRLESDHFLRLISRLLFRANEDLNLVDSLKSPRRLLLLDVDLKLQLRDHLLAHLELIDAYLDENSSQMSPGDVETIVSWRKYFLKDRFYILRHLKKHSIFLSAGDDPLAYGVLAPALPTPEVIGPTLPRLVEAVLLPFKGRIIYDGLLRSRGVYYGPNMSQTFEDDYRKARSLHGVITTLPYVAEKPTEEDLLRAYLKTIRDRDQYWDEIQDILVENPALRPLYHQEMGRLDSRGIMRRLKDMGVSQGWFGVLEGMIVASGAGQEDLEMTLREIIPQDRMQDVYIFRAKR